MNEMWPHKAIITHENDVLLKYEKKIETTITTIMFESNYQRMHTEYKYMICQFWSDEQLKPLEEDFINTYYISIYKKDFSNKFKERKNSPIKGFSDWTSALVYVFSDFDRRMREK